jgi:preprotein translocase subunit SecE
LQKTVGRARRRARLVCVPDSKLSGSRMADTIRSTRDFITDVQTEMKKVTWPDWPQLKNSTFVILVFVVVVALIIFAMDFVVNRGLEMVRSILGG